MYITGVNESPRSLAVNNGMVVVVAKGGYNSFTGRKEGSEEDSTRGGWTTAPVAGKLEAE